MALRWMSFVDGENLAIRAKQVLETAALSLPACPWYLPDTFIWPPQHGAIHPIPGLGEADTALSLEASLNSLSVGGIFGFAF